MQRLVPGDPNRTKMLHVKHFGKVEAKNLAAIRTAGAEAAAFQANLTTAGAIEKPLFSIFA